MPNTNEIVASFRDYAGAQRVVDALADRHFAVDGLAIVGANLQSYEQITGRRGYRRAAAEGFTSGAIVGVLIGVLLGLFALVQPLVSAVFLALWGVVIGGVVGAVVGLVSHALTDGRRDFSSTSSVRAERYDVVAEPAVAEQARREIAEIEPSAVNTPPAGGGPAAP